MKVVDIAAIRQGRWQPTRWSVVQGLGPREIDERAEDAWNRLVEAYREPMVEYVRKLLARTGGDVVKPQDAEDVVSNFLAACVEKGWLATADPKRGPFRAFIQMALKRQALRAIRNASAQKRRPSDAGVVSLEAVGHEQHAASSAGVDSAFELSWAEVAVARALTELAAKSEREAEIIRDLIATDGKGSADLPERLGVSRPQFPVLKHRARKRFGSLLSDELRATVSNAEEFQVELKTLGR